jgi:probable O-glycosylation ligase (exosortase A-associated)
VRAIVLTLVYLVLVWWTFGRPWMGIVVWSWFSYMNPHRFAWGFAYVFPWVAVTAVLTFFVWITSSEKKRFPWTLETMLEIALCVWITITSILALGDPQVVWAYWERAIKVQAMIFMTLCIMQSRFRLNALIWTIAISIGFFGVKGGIWTLLTGGHYRVQGPERTFIEGNNELGLAMVMVLPLMHYLQLQAKSKWLRRGLVAAQLLTAVAVLATYSRGGLIALSVVGFLLWLKSRRKLLFATVMILFAVPMFKFMPAEWKDRMHTIGDVDEEDMDASAVGRLNAWRFSLALVMDRPLEGGGFRVFVSPAFAVYAPDPRNRHDAHSIYFEALGEHGLIGLLLFLSLGLSTWFTARRIVRRVKRIPDLAWMGDMVNMTLVGLAGYATGGAFAGLTFFDLPYHLMSIVVICKLLLQDHIREAVRLENQRTIKERLEPAIP